jgi:hypothetical protein
MSRPNGSGARVQNKDNYEFLCFCESCRNLSWRDVQDGDVEPTWPDNLPEDQRKVPGDRACYLSYRTSKQHLQDARNRRIKQGNRNVDPYETMWKELANGGRFFVETFGATPFAKPGRVISTRAKRGRGENGDVSDDEEGDWGGGGGPPRGGGGGGAGGEVVERARGKIQISLLLIKMSTSRKRSLSCFRRMMMGQTLQQGGTMHWTVFVRSRR